MCTYQTGPYLELRIYGIRFAGFEVERISGKGQFTDKPHAGVKALVDCKFSKIDRYNKRYNVCQIGGVVEKGYR